MARKIIGSIWDREARNAINDNFEELYGKAESVQAQFNQVVIEGDSSVEAAQARVDAEGKSYPTLKARLDAKETEFSSQLAQNLNFVSDYSLFPQSPKPAKTAGLLTQTPKLIWKPSADEMHVFSKTNKGFVQIKLQRNIGASQEGRDYGLNHELIRLVGAYHIPEIYVYHDMSTPISGVLEKYYKASLFNSGESILYEQLPNLDNDKNLSSKGNGHGFDVFSMEPGEEVEYRIPVDPSGKANVLFMCTTGGSRSVQIFVNGEIVREFNTRSFVTENEPTSMKIIEFEVPSKSKLDYYILKIRNNNDTSTGRCYPVAINFHSLSDYKGQHITGWKAFGSIKTGWITNNGASDYAFVDKETGLWCGSYHGGEISEYDRVYWQGTSRFWDENRIYHAQFDSIEVGDWKIQKYFQIFQRTSLANGKANMVSRWNFDTDGTMEMDMGFYNSSLNISTFYTALTCTDVNFEYLFQPVWKYFGTTPSNGFFSFPVSEGRISQVSSSQGLQLDIRFTKFNEHRDNRGATIADNAAYRKFYYGPLYQFGSGYPMNALTFSKGLDFIVR